MSGIFLEVFNLSIAACWLIVAVLIVRALFAKRMPKWLNCCLWGLVAIRLLIPFTFESKISLVPNHQIVINGEVSEYVTEDVSEPVYEDLTEESIAHNTVLEDTVSAPEVIPDQSVDVSREVSVGGNEASVPETVIGSEENIHFDNETVTEDEPPIVENTVTEEVRGNGVSGNFVGLLSTVWACGVGGMLLYALLSYFFVKRRVALSVPCGERVRKGEGVDSPFVFGLFRPRIYIPYGLSAETEQCVIAHERAHLKRGDHLIKPLGFFILSVYWFNPLVWVAYILLCRDIEYACDEKVINDLAPEARKAYALALLECAVSHKRIAACPIAFGETGVKERVKNTMSYKKPAFWIIICGVLACVIVAVLFLTTSSGGGSDDSSAANESGEESAAAGTDESKESEESKETSEDTDASGDPSQLNYIDGLFAAELIEYDDLGNYDYCHRYESDEEYNIAPMLFTPKTVIYDVRIFSIDYDLRLTDGEIAIDGILFEIDRVSDEKPLLADIEFSEAFAVNGISFTDEDGKRHFYRISDSVVDGSLIINDFEYTFPGETSESKTDKPEASGGPSQLDYIDGLFAAELIEYDDLGNYDYCHRYESDEEYNIIPILFTPKTVIYDVRIYSIADDWGVNSDGSKSIENILFEIDRVSNEKPLLADIKFADVFAVNGISFKDKDGNVYYYDVTDSAVDGSLIISDYDYAPLTETGKSETNESQTSESQTSEPQISEAVFVPDYAVGQANVAGNTNGNSQAAEQGNWIYYADGRSITKIYKSDYATTAVYKVSSGNIFNINVVGDWIYFCVSESNTANSYIAKVRTDGSKFEKLLVTGEVWEMIVVKDTVYYTPVKTPYNDWAKDVAPLYSMSVNGSSVKQIQDGCVSSLCTDGSYVYFLYETKSGDKSIYRMKSNGTSKNELWISEEHGYNVETNYITPAGSKICFFDLGGEGIALTSINTNGGGYSAERAVEICSEKVYVSGSKCYYFGMPCYFGDFQEGYGLVELDTSSNTFKVLYESYDEMSFYSLSGLIILPDSSSSVKIYNIGTGVMKTVKIK